MAAVARELDALKDRVLLMQILDDVPGPVVRAVVDKYDAARLRDLSLRHHIVVFIQELFGGVPQDLLLIIAWNGKI